jgi:Ca-activated chloride channel family protein
MASERAAPEPTIDRPALVVAAQPKTAEVAGQTAPVETTVAFDPGAADDVLEPPAEPASGVAPPAPPAVMEAREKAPMEERAASRRSRKMGRPSPSRRGPSDPDLARSPLARPEGDSAIGGEFEDRRDAWINDVTFVREDALSTFAIDVDTAAYSIARRTLLSDRMPSPGLVRVEELVNYFHYDYDPPEGDGDLFSIQADGARSPVDGEKHLLRIGIQSKVVEPSERMPANIVFLVDTSGSMSSRDKIGLAKKSIRIATARLGENDRVAITTYAGGVRLVLEPTNASNRRLIDAAIDRLATGGGTAMSDGLTLAYEQAAAMVRDGAITRVIVLSDGDANIGATNHRDMLRRIEAHKNAGVFLSTIGYGDGNYKDATMERIANEGNGNYYYVDSERMAERVFGRDFTKMIQDVAQDVKIQVELDPEAVSTYRLVGYENRDVRDADFRNDQVDAGEIGAGHQVTALYELTLTGRPSEHLATIRVRAKRPRGTTAKEVSLEVPSHLVQKDFATSAEDFRFATAVMGGAELMRRSPHAQAWTYGRVIAIVSDTRPYDEPDRAEFLSLMKKAALLSGESQPISAR